MAFGYTKGGAWIFLSHGWQSVWKYNNHGNNERKIDSSAVGFPRRSALAHFNIVRMRNYGISDLWDSLNACWMCMATNVGDFSLLLGYTELVLYDEHKNVGVPGAARSGGWLLDRGCDSWLYIITSTYMYSTTYGIYIYNQWSIILPRYTLLTIKSDFWSS